MDLVEYPYAGLILPDATDLDPKPYLDSAARVLARVDPIPGAAPHRSAHGNRVHGRRYGVIVHPEEDSDYGPRVVIEIVTTNGEAPAEEEAARVLSAVVQACLDHSCADILEWYSPDVLLDRDDFIRLRTYVSPRRLQEVDTDMEDELFENETFTSTVRGSLYGAPKPIPLEERPQITDRLAQYRIAFEPLEPAERRMTVAGWLMTGVLGTVYLPVAAFVSIVTLGRGMDFRLISQALAVTALFAALYNADRLGDVLNTVIH
ncbi:hypothetical protein [Sagittula salina]|uniref:Uncharacterized protein n=1 Tax=Sagittula salina TaxID=2820268 RepID=A0A940S1L6_9RHOB|nr:hypothetical protein [Sagittula salina]MBP0481069.1 hypothetical protein [Sagittula salina]